MGEVREEGDSWATVVVAVLVCRCKTRQQQSKGLMACSVRLGHVLNPFTAGAAHREARQTLSLTTMSEYDFRPGGSLKLKRTAERGVVKKWVFIYSLSICFHSSHSIQEEET